jgi:oligopeptide/dipeptide ABC transporter ATP-binding protein
MLTPLVSVDGLGLTLPVGGTARRIIDLVDFEIGSGEVLGLVGESGSGKSMTARSLVRLLPPGAAVSGSIRFDGQDVLAMTPAALRAYRASDVGVVFQDPRAQINPVRRIGDFLSEAWRTHRGWGSEQCDREAVSLLEQVWVDRPRHRLRQYPHELSGGLLQRVMIAAALAMEPRFLIADEPTTALDVTTQAEVLAIMGDLRRERSLSMLFITHDLDLAAAICDRIAVMYAGRVVEEQDAGRLYQGPRHPYTSGLARARPHLTGARERVSPIPGRPAAAFEIDRGCALAGRCAYAAAICGKATPGLRELDGGLVACHRAEELGAVLAGAVEHA